MYRVYLHNFDYCLQEVFSTITEARKAGVSTGFQFTILEAEQ